jgi:polyvinyl alcohol dehydrogenase (cytochrome)
MRTLLSVFVFLAAPLSLLAFGAVAGVPGVEFAPKAAANDPGPKLFKAHCAACHEHGLNHAPPVVILNMMSPTSIHDALTKGAMRVQSSKLKDAEKIQVAEYLSGKKLADVAQQPPPPRCAAAAAAFDFNQPPVFAGWGLTPGNTREIPQAVAGLDATSAPHLRLKWAFAFPDSLRARSHPALAGGALYVGSHRGTVYALDRESGCVRWQFEAGAEVRTGLVVAPWRSGDNTAKPLVYFGDLTGNIFALDALTGALVWRQHADEHPSTTITAAPALYQDRLYVSVASLEEANISPHFECCKFRGSVIAYDAASGAKIWQTFLTDKPRMRGRNKAGARMFGPSGVGVWNTPAIDPKRGQLTVGTGDNYSSPTTSDSDSVVALDLGNGKVKWVYQARADDAWNAGCGADPRTLCPKENGPDYDFGAATILATASDGQDYLLAGEKSGDVMALDPDDGHLYWKTKVGRGGILAGVYFGMAVSGDSLFVPISDMPDGRSYQEPAQPGLYALDIRTGQYLWRAPGLPEVCQGRPFCWPGIAGAVTATPALVLAGASDGWVRVYDAASGRVLWQFDTAQSFAALGGGTASGGSMGGGSAPVAFHGALIVPSGYGYASQRPGNVLLMFESGP